MAHFCALAVQVAVKCMCIVMLHKHLDDLIARSMCRMARCHVANFHAIKHVATN